MQNSFRMHGSFSNRCEGALLISEVEGPWNIELVTNWSKDCYAHALDLSRSGQPWVWIGVIHGSMVCPPDALLLMKKAALHGAEHLGVIANAVVASSEVEGFFLMKSAYAKLYHDCGLYSQFDNLKEAQTWATGLLLQP
jgi:hypothetical protein